MECPLPASLVDVMPTKLSAAGIPYEDLNLSGTDLTDLVESGADGSHGDRTVYSQYSHRDLGVYMAANRRWKYSYSSPDRLEYLFDREMDPDETRSRAGLAFRRDTLREMRETLFEHYRSEGVTDCLDGEGWRQYPRPAIPQDPDAGLLIQDPPWAEEFQAIPGYTD